MPVWPIRGNSHDRHGITVHTTHRGNNFLELSISLILSGYYYYSHQRTIEGLYNQSEIVTREVAFSFEDVNREADVPGDAHHQREWLVTSAHLHPVLEVKSTDFLHHVRFLVKQGKELGFLQELVCSIMEDLLKRRGNEGVGVA